jgi:N-ethylmaleimide reductase
MKDLFTPIEVGTYKLKNRIFMAPMTRCRAIDGGCANEMMSEYYAQRASAGLIIAEATKTSAMSTGYPNTPGIYEDKHIESWREVTDAVHAKGGVIFLQIWHVGRVSHSSFLDGALPVAPSPIKPDGEIFTPNGMQPFETPKALEEDEIKNIINDFVISSQNAIKAGFDGVEIHGANGYLIDQFIRDGSNKRDDKYGGSIENRSRFLFEILDAVSAKIGSDKVGVRLSPSGTFNSMSDLNPNEDYKYICQKLNDYDLAYLHIIRALEGDIRHGAKAVELKLIRDAYNGVIISNGGYDKEQGNKEIKNNLIDAVAYGHMFISNPDLPKRFEDDLELCEADQGTFYTSDAKGYIDYKNYEN